MVSATDDSRGDAGPTLAELLSRHRPALVRFLRSHGAGLARFESAEDLAQGVHLRALEGADNFRYQGEKAFLGWMFVTARRHIADRAAYWKALRRNAGPVLRITYGTGGTGEGGRGVQPLAEMTGPSTHASRRDLIETTMRALAVLPARDATLVRMSASGASVAELAETLELSYEAAQRARLRALDRFRKVMRVARSGPTA